MQWVRVIIQSDINPDEGGPMADSEAARRANAALTPPGAHCDALPYRLECARYG